MENVCQYYCFNIIESIKFFSALNITVNTTLKYCHKKPKIMGVTMKIFSRKFLGQEIFSSMVPKAVEFFEWFVKPSTLLYN